MTTCCCMGPQRGEPLCPCQMAASGAYDRVDKASAWDAIAEKNAEIARLRQERDYWEKVARDKLDDELVRGLANGQHKHEVAT